MWGMYLSCDQCNLIFSEILRNFDAKLVHSQNDSMKIYRIFGEVLDIIITIL